MGTPPTLRKDKIMVSPTITRFRIPKEEYSRDFPHFVPNLNIGDMIDWRGKQYLITDIITYFGGNDEDGDFVVQTVYLTY